MSDHLSIAIDGPVASGKTTVGLLVAKSLSARFLDTGLMYRAITYVVNKRGTGTPSAADMTSIATSVKMQLITIDKRERLIVDGQDITDQLREPSIERMVSQVSKVSGVRRELVRMQQQIACEGPIVMVGRDIGTIVLTNATLKVYLNAPVEVRAQRRYQEIGDRTGLSYEQVLSDLQERDSIDTERADSPLKPSGDAMIVDTTGMTVTEVVDVIVKSVG